MMNLSLVRFCVFLCVAMGGLTSYAELVHKYTFNEGNANDSVGGMHGEVIDNTGISGFSGGRIDLSANDGESSNQDFSDSETRGAYVNLPNDIFADAAFFGDAGQVSLEIWFSTVENRNWAEVFTFGTSDNGEDTSVAAENSDYVALIPNSGPGDFRATTRAGTGIEAPLVGSVSPLSENQKHHVVFTLDQGDMDGGANTNGTARLYLNDNGSPVSEEIQPLIQFMVNNNNWLGRSQWGDALFDGFIDEFRIYDHALTPSEVSASFIAGPDSAPFPVLVVDRETGEISIENQTGDGIGIKGYSITSAGGSIDTSGWTSIDSGSFDTNGTWTVGDFTEFSLEESNTGGVLDGGTLAGNSAQSLGFAWEQTSVEDLIFSYTLDDDTTGLGQVQYQSDAISRSDLNGDGDVNATDWSLFLANSATTFATDTAVIAAQKGDLDNDLDNDYDDFKLFKSDFVAANGLAAFHALTQAVPEPSSISLVGLMVLGMVSRRTRR